MALLQIIQTDHGIPATYWKISSAIFNLDGSCDIKLNGYIDESARRNNYEAMKIISYTVSEPNMTTVFASGFNLVDAYSYVKTQTEFLFGSVDVL